MPESAVFLIRRLLLIPLTLLGITLLVFMIQRTAPGGPMEQALTNLLGGETGARKAKAADSGGLSIAQLMDVEEKFRRDRTLMRGYFDWLGGLLSGDLGVSLTNDFPIAGIILVVVVWFIYHRIKVIRQEERL